MSFVRIQAIGESLELAEGASAEFAFDVVNATDAPVRVGVEPIGASRALVRVDPDQVELSLPSRGQQKVKVAVKAPAPRDANGASFKLRVYRMDDPEQAVESAAVGIALTSKPDPQPQPEDPKPPRPFPWLIVAGAAAAVVLVIGIVVTVLLLRPSKVPDVVGMPLDDALAALSDADLTPSVTEEVSGATETGHVIRQSPDGGETVPDDGTVTIAIEMLSVPVPRAIGLNVRAAEETLASAGLALGETTATRTDRSPGGTVIGQEPPEGARAIPGSAVTLTVEKQLVRVRELKGLSWPVAANQLKQDGLSILKGEEVNTGAPAGTVVAQVPAPGTDADVGDVVKVQLEVGKVTVPLVVGASLQDAIRKLGSQGLVLAPIQPLFKTAPPFDVVGAQTPAASAQVPPGTAVTLRVATQAPRGATLQLPATMIKQLQTTRPLVKTPFGIRSVAPEQ
jgi:beta-lactam-binding protein with PASTA domain